MNSISTSATVFNKTLNKIYKLRNIGFRVNRLYKIIILMNLCQVRSIMKDVTERHSNANSDTKVINRFESVFTCRVERSVRIKHSIVRFIYLTPSFIITSEDAS